MLNRKSISKKIRIEIIPLELKDFNGDKRAFFLSELQLELADNYVVQYGKDFRTLVFYEINSPQVVWQTKLSNKFKIFVNEENNLFRAFALTIPITFLRTRASEQIIVRIKKTTPIARFEIPEGECEFDEPILQILFEGKNVARYDKEMKRFEIYQYSSWDKIGIKYRSDK